MDSSTLDTGIPISLHFTVRPVPSDRSPGRHLPTEDKCRTWSPAYFEPNSQTGENAAPGGDLRQSTTRPSSTSVGMSGRPSPRVGLGQVVLKPLSSPGPLPISKASNAAS